MASLGILELLVSKMSVKAAELLDVNKTPSDSPGMLDDLTHLGGGFKSIFFTFTPKIGEDEPILTTVIFFKWVETTN